MHIVRIDIVKSFRYFEADIDTVHVNFHFTIWSWSYGAAYHRNPNTNLKAAILHLFWLIQRGIRARVLGFTRDTFLSLGLGLG